jgi:hypothetical protein
VTPATITVSTVKPGNVATSAAGVARSRTLGCGCGHPESVHDPIATRYCAATLDSAL